jgi:sugar phosphate isomerase/epimerase
MSGFSINVRIGVWVSDLRLGVKAGLKAAAVLQPEALGLDAFEADISPRNLGLSGRRDLARHARSVAPISALKADVGGRRLADAKNLDTNLERLRDVLHMAADLGAPRVQIAAGFVPDDLKENATDRSALAEAVRALNGIANNSGVRVCWLAGSEAAETLAQFLSIADPSAMIEVDLNPGAFVMRGADPLKALNALSSRVSMARAADHWRGGAEAPFGKGDVRWGEVLVGLSSLSRNVPIDILAACAVEGDRAKALGNAVARLKAVRANPI